MRDTYTLHNNTKLTSVLLRLSNPCSVADVLDITQCSHDMMMRVCTDELVHEKEKYKYICDDLDQTFCELIG